jgi:hypothetical protein
VKWFTTISQCLRKRFARKCRGIGQNSCVHRQCHTVTSTLDPFRNGYCSVLTSPGVKCADYHPEQSIGLPNGVVIRTPPSSPIISLSPQFLPFQQCKDMAPPCWTCDNRLTSAAFQSLDANLDQFLTLTNPTPIVQHRSDTGTALQAAEDVEWLSFIRSEFSTTPVSGRNQGIPFGYGFHYSFLYGLPWYRFQSSLNMPGRSFGLRK